MLAGPAVLPRPFRIVLILALACAGCGGGPADTPAGSPFAAPGVSGPVFPPAAQPRYASASLEPVTQAGSDFINSAGDVEVVGGTAVIAPLEPLSYAMYGLSGLTPYLLPSGLSIETDAAIGTPWYIGIADYGLSRWRWIKADGPHYEQEISDLLRCISPGGGGIPRRCPRGCRHWRAERGVQARLGPPSRACRPERRRGAGLGQPGLGPAAVYRGV